MSCTIAVAYQHCNYTYYQLRYLGVRRNSLTLLEFLGQDKSNKPIFKCCCDCGNFKITRLSDVLSGKTKSCGCLSGRIEEKLEKYGSSSNYVVYSLWKGMRARCLNPRHRSYKNYGGRGIVVCSGWSAKGYGFINFLNSVGTKPGSNYSIDRIDNNGNYSCGQCSQCLSNAWPMNCKWSTKIEQCSNTRNNVYIEYLGEHRTVSEWCELLGLSKTGVYQRITKLKQSPLEAITINIDRIRIKK